MRRHYSLPDLQQDVGPNRRRAGGAFLLGLTLCFTLLHARGLQATDPTKDPQGWGELRFGMTAAEVLATLGGTASVAEPHLPRPLMQGHREVPDIKAALDKAETLIAAKGSSPQASEAAKKIVRLIKPRTWKGYPFDPFRASERLATVSGVLENTEPDLRYVLIRPRNRRVPSVSLRETGLDAKSEEHVREVQEAVFDLSEVLLAEERGRLKAGPLDPGQIKVNRVVIRGITLQPSLTFAGGKLTQVQLGTPGADNPTTPPNPNRFGMHATIRDELQEKYGPPTEKNRTESVDFVIWRFPTTVISCGCHSLGIQISYKQNTDTAEKKKPGL